MDRASGNAYAIALFLRQSLRHSGLSTRLSSLLLTHRTFDANDMAAIQAIQHIIAPPPPPIDLPDDAEWTPSVPPGQVLLEVRGH